MISSLCIVFSIFYKIFCTNELTLLTYTSTLFRPSTLSGHVLLTYSTAELNIRSLGFVAEGNIWVRACGVEICDLIQYQVYKNPSWYSRIQFKPSHPVFLGFIIVSSHICPGLQSGVFLWDVTKHWLFNFLYTSYMFFLSHTLQFNNGKHIVT